MKVYLIPSVIAESKEETTIPLEIRNVVQCTDLYFVENIRTARRYVSKILRLTPGNEKKVESLAFRIVNKATSSHEVSELFKEFSSVKQIGVLSESGCPGIADPGSLVVQQAHQNGYQVLPLVGPSSLVLALMGSGMNGQNFAFHGYLPIEKKEREKRIMQLESSMKRSNQTQLFIETPYRNQHMMESLIKVCRPETQLCIATDLTGESEYIRTQSIGWWRKNPMNLPKLPTVFLLN